MDPFFLNPKKKLIFNFFFPPTLSNVHLFFKTNTISAQSFYHNFEFPKKLVLVNFLPSAHLQSNGDLIRK